jgi:hypothetical protein
MARNRSTGGRNAFRLHPDENLVQQYLAKGFQGYLPNAKCVLIGYDANLSEGQ